MLVFACDAQPVSPGHVPASAWTTLHTGYGEPAAVYFIQLASTSTNKQGRCHEGSRQSYKVSEYSVIQTNQRSRFVQPEFPLRPDSTSPGVRGVHAPGTSARSLWQRGTPGRDSTAFAGQHPLDRSIMIYIYQHRSRRLRSYRNH